VKNNLKATIVGVAICLLSVISISIQPALAKVKPGTECKKIGLISKFSSQTYKCVKSGKKLIWITQPKTKLPSENIPTPNQIPREIMPFTKSRYPELLVPQKVYKSINLIIAPSVKYKTESLFLVEPFSQMDISVNLQKGLKEGLNFLSLLDFQIKSPFIVVFAQTNDWAKEILIQQGCIWEGLKSSDFKPLSWTGVKIAGKCVGTDGVSREAIVQNVNTDGKSIESMHTLTHEVFHIWQSENVSSSFGLYPQNYFPRWFYESVPQAITVMAYANWNPDRSYDQWLDYWIGRYRNQERTSCISARIQDLVVSGSDLSTLCVYSKGVLAIDILIANYGGIESLKNLYTSHKLGQDFSVTFKEVTGKDITQFYNEVNDYFVERNWNSPS
jgi:hypothetical protein